MTKNLAESLQILDLLHVLVVHEWADVLSVAFRSTGWGSSVTCAVNTTVNAAQ